MSAPGVTPPPAADLLLPIGHSLGLGDLGAVEVRLGAAVEELPLEEFSLWALAHGDPDGGDRPWGADQVLAAAARAGLADAAEHLSALEQRGLLVRATPGAASARALADRVRLLPLAIGLGNTRVQPQVYRMGRSDELLAVGSSTTYDLFTWAHMETSLWRACVASAAVASRAGASDPGLVDPDELLTGLLSTLHPLLVTGAVCLDTWGVAA
ncbi:hypothetical protein SAMN05660199_04127 [Klenkia soli]|uniref:Uncharacterized protein n=1 Tax=Klenkia soli TaxID=1052260 RepID=A0A1H0TFQ5_9ACTN|nr:hypothetical protein [Klenkia soli]SDP52376.1 hypothetical protein SAMN05660199_04127 [Klenkia soli]